MSARSASGGFLSSPASEMSGAFSRISNGGAVSPIKASSSVTEAAQKYHEDAVAPYSKMFGIVSRKVSSAVRSGCGHDG